MKVRDVTEGSVVAALKQVCESGWHLLLPCAQGSHSAYSLSFLPSYIHPTPTSTCANRIGPFLMELVIQRASCKHSLDRTKLLACFMGRKENSHLGARRPEEEPGKNDVIASPPQFVLPHTSHIPAQPHVPLYL